MVPIFNNDANRDLINWEPVLEDESVERPIQVQVENHFEAYHVNEGFEGWVKEIFTTCAGFADYGLFFAGAKIFKNQEEALKSKETEHWKESIRKRYKH